MISVLAINKPSFTASLSNLGMALPLLSAAAFLGISAIAVIWFLFQKKNRGKTPVDRPIQQDHLDAILDSALVQRSKIELVLRGENKARRIIQCSLRKVGPQSLELELPGFLNIAPSWKDKSIEGYLNLMVQQKHRVSYNFTATILDFASPEGFPCIILSRPHRFCLGQKRMHLRVSPPSMYVRSIAILGAGSRRRVLEEWKEPESGTDDPPQNRGMIQVRNLSAGGIRLALLPKNSPVPFFDLKKSRYVLFHLHLKALDQDDDISCFILGRVRNLCQDPQTKSFELGIQYELTAASPAGPDGPRWTRVTPEMGIDEIGDWVFKLHLDLYREKGLT